MEERADRAFDVRLQVGRRLRNPVLGVAVLLRNVGLAVLTYGVGGLPTELLAPAWVVITDKAGGKELGRLAAGRVVGAGEELLADVRADLAALDVPEFSERYELVRAG